MFRTFRSLCTQFIIPIGCRSCFTTISTRGSHVSVSELNPGIRLCHFRAHTETLFAQVLNPLQRIDEVWPIPFSSANKHVDIEAHATYLMSPINLISSTVLPSTRWFLIPALRGR